MRCRDPANAPDQGADMEVFIQLLDEMDDLAVGFAHWLGTWPRTFVIGGLVSYCAGLLYLWFA